MEMEFVDRVAEHLNRRKLTIISQTPTEIIADISRAEGNVETPGTPLTASNLKKMQQVVADADAITSNINTVKEDVNTLKGRANSTDNEIASIKDQCNATDVEVSNLKVKANTLQIKTESIDSEIATIKTRCDATDVEVSDLKTKANTLQSTTDWLKGEVENVQGQYYDLNALIYPVGSVYISAKEGVSPAALFGGEWEQIKDAFLLASSDLSLDESVRKYKLGVYGGEEQHVLTEAEMPIHSHMSSYTSSGDVGDRIGLRLNSMSWDSDLASYDYSQIAGGGQAHNNMPPYITVNAWWRRA